MVNGDILLSWIGHNDLWAMAEDRKGEMAELVELATKLPTPPKSHGSPTRTIVNAREFAEVHLLTDYRPKDVNNEFAAWLGHPGVRMHPVELPQGPTNYRDLFDEANRILEEVYPWSEDRRLCMHLSPGTPAMSATLLLLGKTRYPAILYQTYKGEVEEISIPFELNLLIHERLREPDRLLQSLTLLSPSETSGFESLVGESRALRSAVALAKRVAVRDVPVLLTGETGTGKEHFARCIHNASTRKQERFVPVNCAALPRDLFEAELFGVEEKTATGVAPRPGAFREANGGTLFLDEVGELSLDNQTKLLRALQRQPDDPPCRIWVKPVGKEQADQVDVRIIAATNRDLLRRVSESEFREDLYFRLATFTIELPPLRERAGDVRLLANYLLKRIQHDYAPKDPSFDPSREICFSARAMHRLCQHQWPGNVRELENVLIQAAVLSSAPDISGSDIDYALSRVPDRGDQSRSLLATHVELDLQERMNEIERYFITDALHRTGGNQRRAAKYLSLKPQTLAKKMQRLGLAKPSRSR